MSFILHNVVPNEFNTVADFEVFLLNWKNGKWRHQDAGLIACPSGPTIQTVSVKNTLNYPILFGYFGDLAKFSQIFHKTKIFYNLWFFCKNLAMFNFVL